MKLVVKVGGDLLVNGLPQGIIHDIEALRRDHKVVVVHGGGDVVTDIATKLGHPPRFVMSPRGFRSRYTDKETSEIYTMVMAGKINKAIVSALQRKGIPAIGLSGLDGSLIRAKRKKKLIILDERGRKMLIEGGYTGQIEKVNTGLLEIILKNDYLPVVSPIAIGEEAEHLNVDGDRTAARISAALNADRLILLTDVEGVYLEDKKIDELYYPEVEDVVERVGGGMVTKVYAAIEALRGGVSEVVIACGFKDAAITSALEHRSGTVIRR